MRRTTASIVAAALCLPVAVGVALLSSRTSATADDRASRHDALKAATRIAADILSYDYRTIDHDLARVHAETTGSFGRQYDSAAADLRAAARQAHAIVQARVRDAGIVSSAGGRVVVLVFADQVSVTRTASSATPTTKLIPSAVQLTLTESAGRWRVSALTAVQAGAGSGSG